MFSKTFIIDSTHHDVLEGENVTYYSGYYNVNDKRFFDDGNNDCGRCALIPVSEYIVSYIFDFGKFADRSSSSIINDVFSVIYETGMFREKKICKLVFFENGTYDIDEMK